MTTLAQVARQRILRAEEDILTVEDGRRRQAHYSRALESLHKIEPQLQAERERREPHLLAQALDMMGQCNAGRRDDPQALRWYEEAVAVTEQHAPSGHLAEAPRGVGRPVRRSAGGTRRIDGSCATQVTRDLLQPDKF